MYKVLEVLRLRRYSGYYATSGISNLNFTKHYKCLSAVAKLSWCRKVKGTIRKTSCFIMPQPFIAHCWIYKTWETSESTIDWRPFPVYILRPGYLSCGLGPLLQGATKETTRKKSLSHCEGEGGGGEKGGTRKVVAIGEICFYGERNGTEAEKSVA